MPDDDRIAGSQQALVYRGDGRKERRVLDGFDRARLVEQPVSPPLGQRGAEDVVDPRVVAQIERPPEAREPERERDQYEDRGVAPVGRRPATRRCPGH